MIGIDLLTERAHSRWTVQESADGGCTLGQSETGSAVQEAPGLAMAQRDRHPHHDALTGRLDQLYLKRLVQAFHWGYVVHLTGFCTHRSSPVSVCCAVARSLLASVAASNAGSACEYSGVCCCAITQLLSGLCLWGPFLLGPIGVTAGGRGDPLSG